MSKAIIAAGCLLGVLGVTQIECLSQQIVYQDSVRVAYGDTYKDISVAELVKEQSLEKVEGVRIGNLSAEDVKKVMQRISESNKLRTFVAKGSHLSSEFVSLFDQLVKNNSELTDVYIQDLKEPTLSARESFQVWNSLAGSKSLRAWGISLTGLAPIQNEVANKLLKNIHKLNVCIDAANGRSEELSRGYQMTLHKFIRSSLEYEMYEKKLASLKPKSDEYKTALGKCAELDGQCNELLGKHISYQRNRSSSLEEVQELRFHRNEIIQSMKYLEKLTDDHLEVVARRLREDEWGLVVGPLVK